MNDTEELDMSAEEYNLSLTDPVGYGYYVDGERKIFVKDDSIELRWVLRDGEARLISIGVF